MDTLGTFPESPITLGKDSIYQLPSKESVVDHFNKPMVPNQEKDVLNAEP